MSEELSRKLRDPGGLVGRVTGALGGGAAGSERLVVPLRAGGTLSQPSVQLDVAAALQDVRPQHSRTGRSGCARPTAESAGSEKITPLCINVLCAN